MKNAYITGEKIMSQSSKESVPRPRILRGLGRTILYPENCPVVQEEGEGALRDMIKGPLTWKPAQKQCFCDMCDRDCPHKSKDHYPKEVRGVEQVYIIFDPPSPECLIGNRSNGSWARFSTICASEGRTPFEVCGLTSDCLGVAVCREFKLPF